MKDNCQMVYAMLFLFPWKILDSDPHPYSGTAVLTLCIKIKTAFANIVYPVKIKVN